MSNLRLNAEQRRELGGKAAHIAKDSTPLTADFVDAYYQFLNTDTIQDIEQKDLAGMAVHHLSLLKHYYGKPLIVVANPAPEEHQFFSQRTVIQMVAKDRPFLVDTMLMVLESFGLTVHRLYNTILKPHFDQGALTSVEVAVQSGGMIEGQLALLHCEVIVKTMTSSPRSKTPYSSALTILTWS